MTVASQMLQLYLLDSSVLIDAKNKYYKINQVPQFWTWLESRASDGHPKIPEEMYKELVAARPNDDLRKWVIARKGQLLLQEEVSIDLVRRVSDIGYAPDLDDEERAKINNDAFLIAYALANLQRRTIVTMEESKPKKQRANRHIPDVCKTFEIRCINTFQMLDELGFRVS